MAALFSPSSSSKSAARLGSDHHVANKLDRSSDSDGAVSAASDSSGPSDGPTNLNSPGTLYDVEHLATFSTSDNDDASRDCDDRVSPPDVSNGDREPLAEPQQQRKTSSGRLKKSTHKKFSISKPRVALEHLFELEKLSGIWTQRMQIQLADQCMLIIDCETNSVVERFARGSVVRPEAFREYNDIYSNIVVFTIKHGAQELDQLDSEKRASDSDEHSDHHSAANDELHIFQCVSHRAQQLVADILGWKTRRPGEPTTGAEMAADSPTDSAGDKMPANDTQRADKRTPLAAQDERPGKNKNGNSNNSNNSNSSIHHQSDDERQRARPADSPPAASSEQQQASKTTNHHSADGQRQASGAKNGKPPVVVTASAAESPPIVNVNVKETVQVFNQIAALREKSSKPSSPTNNTNGATRPLSDASLASSQQSSQEARPAAGQLYKQRSIRATLAPKVGGQAADTKTENKDQAKRADSSSLSSTSGGSSANSSGADQQQLKSDAAANKSRQLSNQDARRQQQQQPRNSTSAGLGKQQPAGAAQNGHLSNSSSSASSSRARNSLNQQQLEQVTTNESYVSVLNHCFDDIEKFIIRLQHAAAAMRELQIKRKLSKRSAQQQAPFMGNYAPSSVSKQPANGLMSPVEHHQPPPVVTASELAMLSAKARGPSEDDYFEILSKFKLAFNLLAKLKGCIHEPNAPELVHFLFTPLAIIIESARNVTPPIDPTLVGIPYLNKDALELLSNCCTSKESDMWHSLGPNWTQTIDTSLLVASRLPSSFQPIFSDGWAPIITELELIGLVLPAAQQHQQDTDTNGEPQQHFQSQRYSKSEAPDTDSYRTPGKLAPANSAMGQRASRARAGSSPPIASHPNGRLAMPVQPFDGDDAPNPYDDQGATPYGYPVASRHHLRSKSSSRRPMRDDYAPPMVPYQHHMNMIPPLPPGDLLDYPANMMVPSDDYTELQADQPAGPSSHYRRSRHSDYSVAGSRQSHYQTSGVSDEALNRARRRSSNKQLANYYPPAPVGDQFRRHASKQQQRAFNQQQLLPQADMGDAGGLLMYGDQEEREAMLLDLGPAQTEWFFELQARGALIVRVLFTREANKDKELSVRRGELLEILDDTRKWWKARNIELQVAYVPHTIVAVLDHYQTLDELLLTSQDAHQPADFGAQPPPLLEPTQLAYLNNNNHRPPQRVHPSSGRHNAPLQEQMFRDELDDEAQANFNYRKDKRNAKTAGAFRYF